MFYIQGQVNSNLRIAKGVRERKLPSSKFEEVINFLKSLKPVK